MDYPSLEEIESVYPSFDTWWRKKYGYFTITPKDSLKLFREYLTIISFGEKKRILPFQFLKKRRRQEE